MYVTRIKLFFLTENLKTHKYDQVSTTFTAFCIFVITWLMFLPLFHNESSFKSILPISLSHIYSNIFHFALFKTTCPIFPLDSCPFVVIFYTLLEKWSLPKVVSSDTSHSHIPAKWLDTKVKSSTDVFPVCTSNPVPLPSFRQIMLFLSFFFYMDCNN